MMDIPQRRDKDKVGAGASRSFDNCSQALLENVFEWACQLTVLHLFMFSIQERSEQDADIWLVTVDDGDQIKQGVIGDAVGGGIRPAGNYHHSLLRSSLLFSRLIERKWHALKQTESSAEVLLLPWLW